MSTYEATFEIESKDDARAIALLMESVYDVLREEVMNVGGEATVQNHMLSEFETLRTVAKREYPGHLTIRYEQSDADFEST